MYRKILVPLDGSQLSESSLEHVKVLAISCNVPEVILFRVIEPIYDADMLAARLPDEVIRSVEKEASKEVDDYLAKAASWLKKDGINVRAISARGNPADQILNYVAENKVDLIVMSTHGRSGVARWALGSVADRVVRHSQIPVLIVSPRGFKTNK